MFCNNNYRIVRPYTEIARSFATIGLLRHVTESTPLDMICTYILQTQQPDGLVSRAYRINDTFNEVDGRSRVFSVREVENQTKSKSMSFPNGIVKMAKDYLVRSFWKQVVHIRGIIDFDASGRTGDYKYRHLRIYPKEVLDELASIRVSSTSSLYDIRHAVATLHSVCVPIMLEPPKWIGEVKRGYGHIRKAGVAFGPIQDRHCRVLSSIMTVLNGYMFQSNTVQHIPNDAEKTVLLDLLECLMIMFGPGVFHENYFLRQCYEYNRLGDILSYDGSGRGRYYFMNHNHRFDPDIVSERDGYDGLTEIIEHLRHLSPEASICVGDITCNDWSSIGCLSENVLKSIRPNPLNEVAIYLKTELDVQRQKKMETERIIHEFKEGRYGQGIISSNYRCCGDEIRPCECDGLAPCAG